MELSPHTIHRIVEQALQEDIGLGDLTTMAIIPAEAQAEARVVMREGGVIAGMSILTAVFNAVDPSLTINTQFSDGQVVKAGEAIAHIGGSVRGMLTGERVALNFVQRLSGIATLTARYVAALEGLPTRILDTRKTTPGLRLLEKYAVRIGGGVNHRFGLYDAIMMKDNHLALLAAQGIDIGEAVRRARAAVGPMVRIEVEVEELEQARLAADAGADIILLDNMTLDAMRMVVQEVVGVREPGSGPLLEASGGITLETVRVVAETGVDYISVGALTHSVRALDISLDMMVLPTLP
jgi:nicotinate-nucleotide pyrophosphorylase (carboxylating)